MRKTFLLVLAFACVTPALRADDVDPEPSRSGAALLRNLKGKWSVTKRVFMGKELKSTAVATYEFDGTKVTVNTGKLTYVASVKVDAKGKPFVLHLTRENTNGSTRMMFKLDKGELFFALVPAKGDVNKNEDFKGTTRPVMILTRDKK